MKAIAFYQNLAVSDPNALIDIELPAPIPGPRDLRVRIEAVSVNPVDVKVRQNMAPPAGEAKILGWDASGIVEQIGAEVTLFQPGDRVWYAGSLLRQGSNSELHLVDERLVGKMPTSLSFAEAAALPLTAITAWELLFDRLQIPEGRERTGETVLIIGAAGGVGSILIQLARQLTGLTVIGSASRPETSAWITSLGADYVIDHSKSLREELQRIGIDEVGIVISLNHTDQHFSEIVEVLRPQGRLALIDDPELFDVRELKRKSISLHWELMFTRSMYGTKDQIKQHALLNRVADLVDLGIIRSTLNTNFGTINAHNLKLAHAHIETNTARGKIVLSGF